MREWCDNFYFLNPPLTLPRSNPANSDHAGRCTLAPSTRVSFKHLNPRMSGVTQVHS